MFNILCDSSHVTLSDNEYNEDYLDIVYEFITNYNIKDLNIGIVEEFKTIYYTYDYVGYIEDEETLEHIPKLIKIDDEDRIMRAALFISRHKIYISKLIPGKVRIHLLTPVLARCICNKTLEDIVKYIGPIWSDDFKNKMLDRKVYKLPPIDQSPMIGMKKVYKIKNKKYS